MPRTPIVRLSPAQPGLSSPKVPPSPSVAYPGQRDWRALQNAVALGSLSRERAPHPVTQDFSPLLVLDPRISFFLTAQEQVPRDSQPPIGNGLSSLTNKTTNARERDTTRTTITADPSPTCPDRLSTGAIRAIFHPTPSLLHPRAHPRRPPPR